MKNLLSEILKYNDPHGCLEMLGFNTAEGKPQVVPGIQNSGIAGGWLFRSFGITLSRINSIQFNTLR